MHAMYAPTGAALSDVVVKLYNGKNDLVETMATDVSGQATFFDLQTGTYRVVAPTDVASTTFGDNMLVGDPDDLVDGETFVFVTNGQLTDAGVFPYAAPGDISGTLTSGAFNSPMLSMKVTLMDAEGSIVAVTQTNSNGGYSFSGLDQNASYTVLVDVKGNNGHYLDDEPFRGDDLLDGGFGVDLTLEKPSVSNVDYHYSNPYSVSKPTSIITGTVAVTTNGDELERLPVTLVDISSGQIITTTTTDDNGNFEFTDIPVGTYYVEVPENNPNDPNQVVTTGLRNPIVVTGGGDATDVLIGYSPLGVITGDVRDTLGNMIPGVDVVLTYPNTQVSVTKVTDQEGRYFFTGLTDLGNYIVTIEVPAEYTIFDDELDSNADPIDGDSTVKYMGTSVSDVDFVLVSGDSVVGTVVDADGNGVSGVMVTLVGTGEDATGQVAYTNGDGAYTFVSVADGGYIVGVSDSPTVEIVAGGGEATVVEPFVHNPTPSNYAVTITGTIQQAGDLIPIDSGVVFELYDAQGTLVATTTTNASGNYVFEDVNPGMYTIKTDTILPGADGNLRMTDDPDGSIDGEVTVIANGYNVILPPFLFAPETLVTPTNDFYDNITRWTSLNDECVDNSEGGVCTMDMQFDVKDCDMTGLYTLMNMEIACSPDAAASGACPKITDPFMNVIVSVQTNDLCEEQQFKIEGAFEPDILLKTDATYAVERPNNRFTLGEMTYWSLRLWTNVTGITIEDANIIKLVRESDGDCEGLGYNPYPFTKDVSLLAQRFAGVNEIVPPEIQTPIRITSGLACAESDNTFNIIDLNFTIRVEYLDGSGISGVPARRRRRDMFKALSPRQVDNGFVTGERWVASDVGVVYDIDTFLNALKLDDIVKGNSMVTQKKASLADSTTLAVFVGGAIALLTGLCCCCCMLASCLLLRKRRQKKREEAVKVIDGTSANFSSTIGSTITFNNISSVGGSYLDRKKSLVPASRVLSNPISNEFVSQEQWIQQPVAMLPDPSVSGGDDVASQLPTIQRSSSRQAQQRPSITNSPRRTSVAMNPSSVSQEQWIQQPVAMLPDPSVSGGDDVTNQLPTIQSSSSRQAQQRPSMTNSPRRTSVATNSSRRTSVATHSSRRPSVSTNTSAKPVSVTNSPVLSRSSVDSPRGNSRAGRTVLKGSVAPEREDSDS
ncbi:hypothetical protein SARC_01353 [Sphaeroforma arctica JP610]|uniref:SD-repeat containing protein B domain-containing protein n=1 Tax=Sphaeroforma arctica JP610 TaxID=667725 RepID=A0A0L0GC06_9EUKA|nr:hypothetical protein SARC_01353 [Sphaeroforma arctica JP610]KNC86525.1 hypothetical protein SARC_01353 [Sphaeroforma arctica JP610]|eukprot:XP_014160427.1 hypothetical protein SARC_01353 [Sphaeroforma arctica JP610]